MFTFHLAVSERARSKSSPVFFSFFGWGEGGGVMGAEHVGCPGCQYQHVVCLDI